MSRTVNRPSPASRSRFHGALRWLILSGFGVAILVTGVILRFTTGPRNGYDIVLSVGMFLIILGAFIAGCVTRLRLK